MKNDTIVNIISTVFIVNGIKICSFCSLNDSRSNGISNRVVLIPDLKEERV